MLYIRLHRGQVLITHPLTALPKEALLGLTSYSKAEVKIQSWSTLLDPHSCVHWETLLWKRREWQLKMQTAPMRGHC